MSIRSTRRGIAALAGLAGITIAIAGCTGTPTGREGESAGGPSVPFGSDAATWQAAFDEWFADNPDIELVWQNGTTPTASGSERYDEAVAKIEEYTNGHVTVEIAWNNAIAPINESYLALQDGRLDWSNVDTFLIPAEFPLTATLAHEAVILRGPSPVADTLAAYGALIQTTWRPRSSSRSSPPRS